MASASEERTSLEPFCNERQWKHLKFDAELLAVSTRWQSCEQNRHSCLLGETIASCDALRRIAEDDGGFRSRASPAERFARRFVRWTPRRRVNSLVQIETINRTRSAFRLTTQNLRGAPLRKQRQGALAAGGPLSSDLGDAA
ncbi:hypothetical protein [Bradyrhizobium shewense]|uniref:hypothetical protein n=1 Tax=Bradyrhizobium shewense TaxID=1761772 RepID=UPI00101AE553|nr:hypothetical protein [Bradyrhizobium shewense]